jgi:hypothetical protein
MTQSDKAHPLAVYDLPTEHIHHPEAIVAIVSCHLRLEGLLSELLRAELVAPESLDFERTGFAQLARIAAATGAVPSHSLRALLKINAIRNRLAHQRDAAVESADVTELVAATTSLGIGESFVASAPSAHSAVAMVVSALMAWLNGHSAYRTLLRERPDLRNNPRQIAIELDRFRDERYPSLVLGDV